MFHSYSDGLSDSVFRLIYASYAAPGLTEDDFDEIAAIAKENNKRLDITGVLVSCGSEFMQILEGYEPQVKKLFEHIARDPRHLDVTVISTDKVKERQFGEWSMGCFLLRPEDMPGGFIFEETDGKRRLRNDAFFRVDDLLETFHRECHAGGGGSGFAAMVAA